MAHANTILEDISAIIGFTATARIAGWYGGRHLYVPKEPGGVLQLVIGKAACTHLCNAYPGERIQIPHDTQRDEVRLRRTVHTMLQGGICAGETAIAAGITRRQVERIRAELVADGFLPRGE